MDRQGKFPREAIRGLHYGKSPGGKARAAGPNRSRKGDKPLMKRLFFLRKAASRLVGTVLVVIWFEKNQ